MFGEHVVYVNKKPLVLVCDSAAYVKILPCLKGLMADGERGFPHAGAKEHHILDFKDRELAGQVLSETDKAIEAPRPKAKKTAGAERG